MKFKSETIPPAEPVRVVTIELPQERATALANAIGANIVWSDTEVEDELRALYVALLGDA